MKNSVTGLLLFALLAGANEQKSAPPGKALGVPTAPITLEVFSDFQCPSCKTLYEETLRPMMADYVYTGKVYLIHRDFPLAMHQHAREAATYANACLRVNHNKYEQVCAALFRQQSGWASNGRIADAIASALTPEEMSKARALLNDPKIAAEIEQDLALGQKANVRQTPTMLISSKGRAFPVSGVINYSILRRFLDDLLVK
jgi:protein-disulfide isomerase